MTFAGAPVQGYLAHKKTPTPPVPPKDPEQKLMVGSYGGGIYYGRFVMGYNPMFDLGMVVLRLLSGRWEGGGESENKNRFSKCGTQKWSSSQSKIKSLALPAYLMALEGYLAHMKPHSPSGPP